MFSNNGASRTSASTNGRSVASAAPADAGIEGMIEDLRRHANAQLASSAQDADRIELSARAYKEAVRHDLVGNLRARLLGEPPPDAEDVPPAIDLMVEAVWSLPVLRERLGKLFGIDPEEGESQSLPPPPATKSASTLFPNLRLLCKGRPLVLVGGLRDQPREQWLASYAGVPVEWITEGRNLLEPAVARLQSGTAGVIVPITKFCGPQMARTIAREAEQHGIVCAMLFDPGGAKLKRLCEQLDATAARRAAAGAANR